MDTTRVCSGHSLIPCSEPAHCQPFLPLTHLWEALQLTLGAMLAAGYFSKRTSRVRPFKCILGSQHSIGLKIYQHGTSHGTSHVAPICESANRCPLGKWYQVGHTFLVEKPAEGLPYWLLLYSVAVVIVVLESSKGMPHF